MQPIFTMQYGEFAVADYLSKKLRSTSVFIPASAQEKGIDLLLYRYDHECNKTNTIQVKMSRTYYSEKETAEFPYYLWFNRFPIQPNANWYVLVGIYAKRPADVKNAKADSTIWDTIMLAFTNKEMAAFMAEVKQKKDPSKDDRMFGFGFDDSKMIYQTRGYINNRNMSQYLIENRIEEIQHSFI
ncbi:MAG: hypothetical protein IKV82_08225 [Akkermansia sp.]|nr:hypothetical protein [Clostridia bacterium]MBR5523434.1 hypothetical protein [Akkermansia sp.]